jgi:hypothetical protein
MMIRTAGRTAVVDAVADLLCARRPDHPLRVAVDGITASGKSRFAEEVADAVQTRGRHGARVSMDRRDVICEKHVGASVEQPTADGRQGPRI